MNRYKPNFSLYIRNAIAIVVLVALNFSMTASSQTKGLAQTEGAQHIQKDKLTPRKGRGKDRNIRRTTRKPPRRGSGSTVCNIQIKNNTKYFIYVYINDVTNGSVGVDNTRKITSEIGRLKVYTRTARENHNFLYWGPSYYTCGSKTKDGSLLLEINP